jgi:hypothetical protein
MTDEAQALLDSIAARKPDLVELANTLAVYEHRFALWMIGFEAEYEMSELEEK